MSQHSVAETKNQLSELIDRAEKGEEIIITRHGHPVAKISGIKPPARALTDADLDWLAARRVGRGKPKEDAGTFVSRMRDEESAALSVYLDASVLVSLFIDDAFAARADKALRAPRTIVVISDFAGAEFASSIARNVRTKVLTKVQAKNVFSDFDNWSQSVADIVEMDPADVRSAETMLRRLDLTLRAPDAIHIAISQRLGAQLATFDKKMADSARILGTPLAKI